MSRGLVLLTDAEEDIRRLSIGTTGKNGGSAKSSMPRLVVVSNPLSRFPTRIRSF